MMLHRHFEEQRAKRDKNMTTLADVTPSDSTDPKDPTYVPVPEPKKAGRPKKQT